MGKAPKPDLSGKVCLVTGASRGIGKGIAMQLAKAGALVYITGRTLNNQDNVPGSLKETCDQIEAAGGKCKALQCDHSQDEQVHNLFATIKNEQAGKLDILVNNAFSAVNSIAKYSGVPYWQTPVEFWDEVNNVGLRNHYVCTVLATQLMVEQGGGLIVNISSAGGLKYLFNVPYGIGKAAVDRMASDCAVEVSKHAVCVVSLWPGPVRTENVLNFFSEAAKKQENKDAEHANEAKEDAEHTNDAKEDAENPRGFESMKKVFGKGSESTEFSGIAVTYLAADENKMAKTGKVLLSTDLAEEYGFTDVDGSLPYSFRSLSTMLSYGGYKMGAWMPSFVKMPRWTLHLGSNKF